MITIKIVLKQGKFYNGNKAKKLTNNFLEMQNSYIPV